MLVKFLVGAIWGMVYIWKFVLVKFVLVKFILVKLMQDKDPLYNKTIQQNDKPKKWVLEAVATLAYKWHLLAVLFLIIFFTKTSVAHDHSAWNCSVKTEVNL